MQIWFTESECCTEKEYIHCAFITNLKTLQGQLIGFHCIISDLNQIPFCSQWCHPLISSTLLQIWKTSPHLFSQEASLYTELHPLESLCVIHIEGHGNDHAHNRVNSNGFQFSQWWNGVEHLLKLNGTVTVLQMSTVICSFITETLKVPERWYLIILHAQVYYLVGTNYDLVRTRHKISPYGTWDGDGDGDL